MKIFQGDILKKADNLQKKLSKFDNSKKGSQEELEELDEENQHLEFLASQLPGKAKTKAASIQKNNNELLDTIKKED
jgi:hypothetical protein